MGSWVGSTCPVDADIPFQITRPWVPGLAPHFLLVQKAVPPPSHPDDHASHGEWYEKIWKKGEMHAIEKLHKDKAGIKTKTTVKKRKDIGTLAKAKPKKVFFRREIARTKCKLDI